MGLVLRGPSARIIGDVRESEKHLPSQGMRAVQVRNMEYGVVLARYLRP